MILIPQYPAEKIKSLAMVSAQSETGIPIVLSSCTGADNPKLFTDSHIPKSKNPNPKLQPQINYPKLHRQIHLGRSVLLSILSIYIDFVHRNRY